MDISDADYSDVCSKIELLIADKQLEAAELLAISHLTNCATPAPIVTCLASIYELSSDYEKTVKLSLGLLSEYPDEPEIIYQLSFALYKLGRHDEALEFLLPWIIAPPSSKYYRLCGFLLKSLTRDAQCIDMFSKALDMNAQDVHSSRALVNVYAELGMIDKALQTLQDIPVDLRNDEDLVLESVLYRLRGDTQTAINVLLPPISCETSYADYYWVQCFNYSISSSLFSDALIDCADKFWSLFKDCNDISVPVESFVLASNDINEERIRIGVLSADIGSHVVSRFLAPLLRSYDKEKYYIVILSTARRYEQKSADIANYANEAVALHGKSMESVHMELRRLRLDVIIETNGFTINSGISLLMKRYAPIQMHYIGYHATTGLKTIDYFLGDPTTTPTSFQIQFTENIYQLQPPWIAYDKEIEFPLAQSCTEKEVIVFGSFSQAAKLTDVTLDYWAYAMKAVPESMLVLKDKGFHCPDIVRRIKSILLDKGVSSERLFFVGQVSTHYEHLDCYNAIDVAFDTTPWSGATTAFEALGMGVPLIAICGDTTSGRMSTSVVRAAGLENLIAHSKEQFADIAASLAKDYQRIRGNKKDMQSRIRAGILFDEQRICKTFFSAIDELVRNRGKSFV